MVDNWDDFRTENSGAGKGISFGQIGDYSQIGVIKGGRILEVLPKSEQRDFEDKTKIRTTKSGKTLWQLPIRVQTGVGQAEPARDSADDDGVRILYVKGLMFDAIDEALKAASVSAPTPGGLLEIAFIGDRQIGAKKMRAFKARYTPGAPPANDGLFPGAAEQAAAHPTGGGGPAAGTFPPAAPVQQPAPADPWAAQAPAVPAQAAPLGQQWAQAGPPPAANPWA
jgi:hypothetical protein